MRDFPLILHSHAEREREREIKNLLKKSESRKEVSVAFQTSLNKIEELEETRSKSSEEINCKTERPKSVNLFSDIGSIDTGLRKRSKSWEPLGRAASFENIRSEPGGRKKQKSIERKLFEVRDCHCWQKARSPSSCDWDGSEVKSREQRTYVKWYSSHPQGKYKSHSKFSKTTFWECKNIFNSENDIFKVKRSLRLLGFELSDFGIFSGRAETTPKWKLEPKSPVYTTKIRTRSVSLDSLRATIKRAWADDCLGKSHRRLLAQAAYEEWYFKKEKELWEKRREERIMRMKERENFLSDFQRKKEKSEEEFRKWLHRKRMKRKEDEENLLGKQQDPLSRIVKSKEESERAFEKWKQTKERESEKKKKEKRREEEKRIESERQKNEKKAIAEKAFQQWKTKLEEREKSAGTKIQIKKKKQEEKERRKREKESQISFQLWKAVKDEQIREKIKRMREADQIKREERQVKLEERIYEAEQAFEDWLEKADLRKQKGHSALQMENNRIIPWIPV